MSEAQFLRLERLIGREALTVLHTKRVTLVGVGAVGGFALESLVRSGVGHIRIIDFDTVEETNLNRQIIALHSTLGKKKTEVAKARALDIWPECDVEAIDTFLDQGNVEQLIEASDIVLDCIDSLSAKCALLSTCQKKGIPVISSMGAALRTDPTRIGYGDIFDTHGCPLARLVRSKLRKLGTTRGITCVYSTEEVNFHYIKCEEDSENTNPHRVMLGSMPGITAIFGEMVGQKAITELIKDVFPGKTGSGGNQASRSR